jgi:hypothetical protein
MSFIWCFRKDSERFRQSYCVQCLGCLFSCPFLVLSNLKTILFCNQVGFCRSHGGSAQTSSLPGGPMAASAPGMWPPHASWCVSRQASGDRRSRRSCAYGPCYPSGRPCKPYLTDHLLFHKALSGIFRCECCLSAGSKSCEREVELKCL